MVSIIIPTYNAEKSIRQTIESVIAQSYDNWEMIVVDDCSKDGTREVIKAYAEKDSRIRLISLNKNNGSPAAPRNIGISEANGEWVAFLDADDIWHPRKLELQIAAIQSTQANFCSTQMKDFFDKEEVRFLEPDKVNIEKITFSRQLRRFRTPTSSVIARRDLLLAEPFNEDPRYKAREDLECWLRIHERINYSIKVLFPLLYYRIVQGQISGSKWGMFRKTYMVFSEYRMASGKMLGWKRYLYTATHILYSIYFRMMKRSL